jgi:hypothetical protein
VLGSGAVGQAKDKPTRRRRSKGALLVSRALKNIEAKLEKDELKSTVGDLVRLVEMEKKLDEEDQQPAEIKVTWVEPNEKEHASGT